MTQKWERVSFWEIHNHNGHSRRLTMVFWRLGTFSALQRSKITKYRDNFRKSCFKPVKVAQILTYSKTTYLWPEFSFIPIHPLNRLWCKSQSVSQASSCMAMPGWTLGSAKTQRQMVWRTLARKWFLQHWDAGVGFRSSSLSLMGVPWEGSEGEREQ